ncbi:hypothetical protein Tco_0023888, partial [Tanacetum coccineum]
MNERQTIADSNSSKQQQTDISIFRQQTAADSDKQQIQTTDSDSGKQNYTDKPGKTRQTRR